MNKQRMNPMYLLAVAVGLGLLAWTGWERLDRTDVQITPNIRTYSASASVDTTTPDMKDESAITQSGAHPQNPLVAIKLSALSETIARPLFSPDRRPPDPPVREQVTASIPPKPIPKTIPFKLVGVVHGPQRELALLKDNQSGQYYRVQQGDYVLGWTVGAVTMLNVSMKESNRLVELSLVTE